MEKETSNPADARSGLASTSETSGRAVLVWTLVAKSAGPSSTSRKLPGSVLSCEVIHPSILSESPRAARVAIGAGAPSMASSAHRAVASCGARACGSSTASWGPLGVDAAVHGASLSLHPPVSRATKSQGVPHARVAGPARRMRTVIAPTCCMRAFRSAVGWRRGGPSLDTVKVRGPWAVRRSVAAWAHAANSAGWTQSEGAQRVDGATRERTAVFADPTRDWAGRSAAGSSAGQAKALRMCRRRGRSTMLSACIPVQPGTRRPSGIDVGIGSDSDRGRIDVASCVKRAR